jgi:hypothetical protein
MPFLAEGQEVAVWKSAGLLFEFALRNAKRVLAFGTFFPFRNAPGAAILLGPEERGLGHGTPSLASE